MLRKNLLPMFVIEGSMAAAEFREKLPDTAFEFIGFVQPATPRLAGQRA